MLMAFVFVLALSGCSSDDGKMIEIPDKEEPALTAEELEKKLADTEKIKAVIDIENYGQITLELYPELAPVTVENFVKLVNDGFYNGLTFHRIIDGFMMQGGDPNGDGSGGSTDTIKGEFKNNGVENILSHVRGVVSMARSGDSMDSASSQFFIVQSDSTFLDGDYAGFGRVTEGMDIVDKICKEVPVTDENGTVQEGSKPIITSITIVE
jgi:peptidyl-prolyl cis-trans isomerase B (cyclophilin B)